MGTVLVTSHVLGQYSNHIFSIVFASMWFFFFLEWCKCPCSLSYIPNTIVECARSNRKKEFDDLSSNGYHQKETPNKYHESHQTPSSRTAKG
jgi:hypothetical protein